jgi:hypothetical protein
MVNLAGLSQPILVFVVAMAVGMLGYERYRTIGAARGTADVFRIASPADE